MYESIRCIKILDRPIKLKRPLNYPKQIPPSISKTDNNLIYVSNIHKDVGEEDLEKIFGCLGECKVFLVYDDHTRPSGYGYVRYAHHSYAKEALKINATLGKQQLHIGPTVVSQELPSRKFLLENELINLIRKVEKEILGITQGSRCIVLKNMIDINELDDDFLREIEEEMAKYGKISKIYVVANKKGAYEIEKVKVDSEQKDDVNVYVCYDNKESIESAIRMMNNRYFGGRRILVEEIDEEYLKKYE